MTSTAQFANTVNLMHKEAFGAGLKEATPKYPMLFGKSTPERLNEVYTVMAGMTSNLSPTTEDGNYNFQQKKEIGQQTVSPLHYKEATRITSFMLNSPTMGVEKAMAEVVKNAHGFGKAFQQNKDRKAGAFWNAAASTTATWDGLSLANASHLVGDTGSTQSNITTTAHATAFSYDDLLDAMQALRNQVDHEGDLMELEAKYIIVPNRAQSLNLVGQYLGSTGTPEDANNSINTIYGGNLQPIVWNRLTNTSIRAILLTEEAKERILEVEYLPFMAKQAEVDPNSGSAIFAYEHSYNFVAVDYLGVQFILA